MQPVTSSKPSPTINLIYAQPICASAADIDGFFVAVERLRAQTL